MDLSAFDTKAMSNDGVWMEVKHPITGAPLSDPESGNLVRIQLLGTDSDEFQKRQTQAADRHLQMMLQTHGRSKMSSASLKSSSLEAIVAVTVSWEGIGMNGEDLQFTPENARVVYESSPWLREQVDAFINDRSNYLGNSSTPSSNS